MTNTKVTKDEMSRMYKFITENDDVITEALVVTDEDRDQVRDRLDELIRSADQAE